MATSRALTGRSFLTRLDIDGDAVWAPIANVARLARRSSQLPSFHEAEFMYMGAVRNDRKQLAIHLYKHRDTRQYLNLDDAGHAYAYRYVESDPHGGMSGGRYQRYRSLIDALEAVELWLFDEEPRFFRSFPPGAWPPDEPRDIAFSGITPERRPRIDTQRNALGQMAADGTFAPETCARQQEHAPETEADQHVHGR